MINAIENNQEVYIRGYGRDAHGTKLFQDLYKILLNNENVRKDPSNNSKPTQLLQNVTNYSKSIKKDSLEKEKINNYQVTHIYGQTKNPFLFTAPWNIVWKSKLLDPFTGHESKGENTNRYKEAFIIKSKELFQDYISEYNELAEKYFNKENVESALNLIKNTSDIDAKTFEKFKIDAFNELKKIE